MSNLAPKSPKTAIFGGLACLGAHPPPTAKSGGQTIAADSEFNLRNGIGFENDK